jgi:polyhydroxyalkanoate synthase subunit PhaC
MSGKDSKNQGVRGAAKRRPKAAPSSLLDRLAQVSAGDETDRSEPPRGPAFETPPQEPPHSSAKSAGQATKFAKSTKAKRSSKRDAAADAKSRETSPRADAATATAPAAIVSRAAKSRETSPRADAATATAPATIVSRAAKSRQTSPRADAATATAPATIVSRATDRDTDDQPQLPDFDAFARNMAQLVEEAGKAIAAYMKPIEEGRTRPEMAQHIEDAVQTFGRVAEYWLSDPKRSLEANAALSGNFLSLWANTLRRFGGEQTAPVTALDPFDKRFADPEWGRNPIFDFLRQAYALGSQWANNLVDKAELDERTREKAQFYVRQVVSAMSPSNFVATNPELIRETLKRNGENLVRGMRMLAEDIEAGRGQLKIRQSDSSRLQLGVDMATTPGKVIFRNDLMELIQYAPATAEVYRRPLLIAPPWINKYYVLDLNPEKSFVRWAVSQGLTVFIISWVNPDARHAGKSFSDYMREGVLGALDAIKAATGERDVAALGYCVGGTLLAITLAYMEQTKDDRVKSASFLTTQVDFSDAGDLKLFVDEARLRTLEESMNARGYLEGSHMASAFNMLRPTELIWSYVVNNYLKGKEPPPFDLLAWNSDSTRMPAANHSFYLRNCYLENSLARGAMVIDGRKLDLSKVRIPLYSLATKEDHIAPARSVYLGAQLFGGPMRYVMAGAGHIAGVVNPVAKPKYQFWTGAQPRGVPYEDWLLSAQERQGSWWPDWLEWIGAQAPEKVPARTPGDGELAPLCDAPGEYVRVKS